MNLKKKPLKILIFSGFNFPKGAQNKITYMQFEFLK